MKFSFDKSLVQKKELKKILARLGKYELRVRRFSRSENYAEWESSVRLPFDKKMQREIAALVKKKCGKPLKYIVVAGIGGSNLGAKSVYDAFFGHFDALEPRRYPKMFFADTVDPEYMSKISVFLKSVDSREEVLLVVISKSGTTFETAANGEILMSGMRKWFGAAAEDRIVFITDKDSKLWKLGKKRGISCLAVPEKVGGRYSVLSAVGLFPLAASGIDIGALLQGAARAIRDDSAKISAAVLFYHYRRARRVHDIFLFHPELESLGKWYRQLLGESLGKEKDLNGKTMRAGILPTVTLGTTDLHSVGQLYFGGPNNRMTTFVHARTGARASVPERGLFAEAVPSISGRTLDELLSIIYGAVKTAYQKNKMPFMEIRLRGITAAELGEFFQFKMLQVMYLGHLMNVNAFDQPNVELYKHETARKLFSNSRE